MLVDMIITSLFAAFAMQAASALPLKEMQAFTDIHRRDMRCATVFAIVAQEQQRGEKSALAYPPLKKRGQKYFADVGERVSAQTGQPKEALQQEFVAIATSLQENAAKRASPEAAIAEHMAKCLPLLDAAIPPPDKPGLPQCAVYLQLAYEEIHAREGLSAAAKDMKTLATVLASRSRDMLRDQGKSTFEIDTHIFTVREQIMAEVTQNPDQNIDYEDCFELAKP